MTSAAYRVELLKFRRARVPAVATVVILLAPPLLAWVFLAAGSADNADPLSVKAGAMLLGQGWSGYLNGLTQIAATGGFVGTGIVAAWCFGREFADHTVVSLYASATSRPAVAAAKLVVITGWSLAVAILSAPAALGIGLLAGLGPPDTPAVAALTRLVALLALTGLLALTVGLVRQRRPRLPRRLRRTHWARRRPTDRHRRRSRSLVPLVRPSPVGHRTTQPRVRAGSELAPAPRPARRPHHRWTDPRLVADRRTAIRHTQSSSHARNRPRHSPAAASTSPFPASPFPAMACRQSRHRLYPPQWSWFITVAIPNTGSNLAFHRDPLTSGQGTWEPNRPPMSREPHSCHRHAALTEPTRHPFANMIWFDEPRRTSQPGGWACSSPSA